MKKILIVVTILAMALCMGACGKTIGSIDIEPGEEAVYIQENGTVSYAACENFDKDYYDKDELEGMISDEIDEYNGKASSDDAITLDSFRVKDDMAIMTITCESDKDFYNYITEYNGIKSSAFYIGNIEDNTECKIKGDFVSPDGSKEIKGKDIRDMDARILIANTPYIVQVDADVLYVSDNCKIDDDGIISMPKSSDGTGYIVYEK